MAVTRHFGGCSIRSFAESGSSEARLLEISGLADSSGVIEPVVVGTIN
jgi:hypothetical protein